MSDPNIKLECIKLAVALDAGPDVLRIAREFYSFVAEGA